MGTYTLGEGAVKKKKFLHAWKPPHCRAGEELWNLRGECSNMCSEGKQREITTRLFLTSTYQPRCYLHSLLQPVWAG